ncbi:MULTISPECIES: hypothetical protein [unclassified Halorubrum]|uniref:hypothetical protein n=1 Tax=unclassified Halorubrum TaxID=2642239 RepID=UPI000BD50EA6|nr:MULTISPECIES: hypothetical protein [unclassified Halorubrum]OYR51300.1 hypothetical protein DJ73_13520 [Halorubrum sp. Ea1]
MLRYASTNRRAVLAAVGAASLGSIAGCSSRQSDEPPTGSLRVINNDETVPHSITMHVTDVGTALGEEPYSVIGETSASSAQRNLSASTTLEPGGIETYGSVFSEPVWYAIEFTVDERPPDDEAGHVVYSPIPDDEPIGRMLTGKVGSASDFWWTISATENAGTFNL